MTPSFRVAAFCLLLVPAATSLAGELLPGDEEIGVEEWREMTQGRTVWYSLGGRHWGREYFHPNGGSATFIAADGECATAPWVHADGLFCFAYTGLDCFRHVRRGDTLLAIPISDGDAQVIEKITDGPLSCEPPLTS